MRALCFTWPLAMAAVLVAGCPEPNAGPPGSASSPASQAADAGGADSTADTPATPGASSEGGAGLRVELTGAPGEALCPADCVTLQANVQGAGTAPSYAWTLGADAQPSTEPTLQVCPASTTTVAVEVSATSRAGEFEVTQRASASATLEVNADGCTPAAWEPNHCELAMPVVGDNAFVNAMGDVDARGNLYLALLAWGEITLAPGRVLGPGPESNLYRHLHLAKFDPRCELQWVKRIDDDEATVDHLGGLDADPEGNLVLLHEHRRGGDETADNFILQTFSTDGESGWALPHRATPGQRQESGVAFGRDGSVAVVGLTELCADDLGFEAVDQWDGTCVGRVDPDGQPVFARFLPGAPVADVDLDRQGNLVVAGLFDAWRVGGWTPQHLAYDPHACPDEQTCRFAAQFDAAGELRWVHVDLQPDWGNYRNFSYTMVHASRTGGVVAGYRTNFGTLESFAPGALVWRFSQSGEETDRRQLFAHPNPTDAHLALSAFPDGVLVTTAMGDFGAGSSIRLRTWDPEGQLLGEGRAEGHAFGNWHHTRATDGDQVVLTRLKRVLNAGSTGYEYTFYVSVLDRPAPGDAPQD